MTRFRSYHSSSDTSGSSSGSSGTEPAPGRLQRYHRHLRLRLACGCPVLIPTRHRRVATALAGQLLAYYIRHPLYCATCDRPSPAIELLGIISPERPARPARRY